MDELVDAARDMLREVEHDGPCVSRSHPDDPDLFDPFSEPCALHEAVVRQRRERLAAAIEAASGDDRETRHG